MTTEARGGDLLDADLLKGFYLGDLLIEPTRGRVTGPGLSEHLPSKAMEVLVHLAEQPGEVVAREELLSAVWGAGRGSSEALSHAVSEIRHALKDHRDDPRYIQTLPKRGYRLLASPSSATGDTATIVLGASNSVSPTEIGLFENLKQRGVLETGLAYLILGWLLIQVADIVFGQLLLPQWVGTFVTVLVIAGFPIALALSWFLEIRDGRAIIDELSPRDARRKRFSRTYISVMSGLAVAAVLVFVYDQLVGLPGEPGDDVQEKLVADLPPVRDNSIAVLPFFNIDGSEETQVFANGLADDVITRLSRVPGLLVSSRGDSFSLEPNTASGRVRERLRVAMYLEGSVQIDGNELRVIVQLIDSETGFHILSRSFSQAPEELFSIRDDITELTVANVRVAVPSTTTTASTLSVEDPQLDVYLLYRRGVEATRKPQNLDTVAEALRWFDAALNIDPDYAAAHAGRCTVFVNAYPLTDDPSLIDSAEAACANALELNPNLDVVHTALGDLYRDTGNLSGADAAYNRALEIYPSSVGALTGLARVYRQQQRLSEAERIYEKAIGLHPGDWSAYNELGAFYYRSGRYEEAAAQYEIVVALDRNNMIGHSNLGTARMLAGDFAGAASALEASIEIQPRPNTLSNLGLMHYYLGDLDAAIESHKRASELAPNDPLTHSNLGDALWIAGRADEAALTERARAEWPWGSYRLLMKDRQTQVCKYVRTV